MVWELGANGVGTARQVVRVRRRSEDGNIIVEKVVAFVGNEVSQMRPRRHRLPELIQRNRPATPYSAKGGGGNDSAV
jgi:hypothetical protein